MKFLREVFSDGGEGSFSRCGAAFVAVSVVAWVTYILLKTKAMPDLYGPAMFLTSGIGVLYGTNKVPDIVSAFKGKQ